ncbi:PaaI family thioesterase [Pendulispora albinea]|uniref:PaaI family thioesterase n=1 Tax=Pendulispora albinea TaxID=2741071 RepID=A0ABZ2LYY6_9BACT
MSDQSIQERLFPTLTCFGCGPANPKGFHLRSYGAEDDTVIGAFWPGPEHDNGFGFLNGGIISTVLDCHTAAAVVQGSVDHGFRALDGAPLPFITAGFDVRFLRPTPLGPKVDLWAKVESIAEQEAIVIGELRCDGKVRASMRAVWKRFRPR